MEVNYKVGDTTYIIESNRLVRKCTVGRISGGIYLIRFEEGGAIQVKKHRLYSSREEAESTLPNAQKATRRLTPYDFWH